MSCECCSEISFSGKQWLLLCTWFTASVSLIVAGGVEWSKGASETGFLNSFQQVEATLLSAERGKCRLEKGCRLSQLSENAVECKRVCEMSVRYKFAREGSNQRTHQSTNIYYRSANPEVSEAQALEWVAAEAAGSPVDAWYRGDAFIGVEACLILPRNSKETVTGKVLVGVGIGLFALPFVVLLGIAIASCEGG